LFGWQVALASLLAGLAVLQIPLMLNVFCHMPRLGYRNYGSTDDSVNVWWVGLLAMGEGWHNNHHAAPGSAKTGMRFWELDVSWLIIRTMKRFGLISRMNVFDKPALSLRPSSDAGSQTALPGLRPAAVPVAVPANSESRRPAHSAQKVLTTSAK
ncbi:MAG TPA: fatty acid desaturase, partial [Chroococcales cyanobacterium]